MAKAKASKASPGLMELQEMALTHAKDVLRRVPFNITEDEDRFAEGMNNITQELISAWAAGYAEGTKRNR